MKISAHTIDTANLIYDPAELERADKIVVMVPGALCRISMFDAALRWRARGYGLVHYRFPGLDGRPIEPALSIKEAAIAIVELARQYPQKPIRLLGFSTGGPIVLTAGSLLSGDVRIGAMACAVERAGGVATFARCLKDIIRAALRARSVRLRSFWFEYYQVLLFGRAVWRDDSLRARAIAITKARRNEIVLPEGGKPRAHTRDLRRWVMLESIGSGAERVRFFWGAEDSVFSYRQQVRLAAKAGGAPIKVYPDQGHLLFASAPEVFEDIYDFFEGKPESAAGAGHSE